MPPSTLGNSYLSSSILGLTRYAAVHEQPEGHGDARPTALQIIEDENLHNGQLTGKTILVTSVSSGIGVEVVKALFVTGATFFFFLTARHLDKAKGALGEVLINSSRVHVIATSRFFRNCPCLCRRILRA